MLDDLAQLAAAAAGAELGWVRTSPDVGYAGAFFPVEPPAALAAALHERIMTSDAAVVIPDVAADAVLRQGPTLPLDGGLGFCAGVPLRGEDGRVLGAVCVGDRRSRAGSSVDPLPALEAVGRLAGAQLDLRTAQLQQQSILGATAQHWFRVDADGRLLAVSPAWTALTGREAAHLTGRPLVELMSTNDQAQIRVMLEDVQRGKPRSMEGGLHRADGEVLPVELSAGPLLGHDGEALPGAVGVLTDLRDRRQREVQQGHDQKLEALGRLSAGIAHEINTPIQFVGDNTRFLADAYEDMIQLLAVYRTCMDESVGALSWEERKSRIAAAEHAADVAYLAAEVPSAVAQSLEGIERVASLVQAMKAFSYKDAVERSYADLNEALETTLTVARNETKYVADVVLDLQDIPPVLCHVGDLNQVFLNLLVNAADALRDKVDAGGGRGEIRIGTAHEGDDVVITVADDAGGIPPGIQAKIFEPFFTTKDVGKGTGQGLALARSVVQDKHGGTITLVSEPGQGSTFVLRLPVVGPKSRL